MLKEESPVKTLQLQIRHRPLLQQQPHVPAEYDTHGSGVHSQGMGGYCADVVEEDMVAYVFLAKISREQVEVN